MYLQSGAFSFSFSTAVNCMHFVNWTYRRGRGKQAIKRTTLIYVIFKMKGGWYKRAHKGLCRKGRRFWNGRGISVNTLNYVPNSSLFPFSHWPRRDCLNNFLSDHLRKCRSRQEKKKQSGKTHSKKLTYREKMLDKLSLQWVVIWTMINKNVRYQSDISWQEREYSKTSFHKF